MNSVLVVAESGLLVDYSLRQSIHSEYLLRQVETNRIALAIPEYAFAETDGGLRKHMNQKQHQLQEMLAFANEMLRSQALVREAQNLKDAILALQSRLQAGIVTVRTELDYVKQLSILIPLNYESYYRGKMRFLSADPPPDENDCLILESILSFLRSHQQDYDLRLFLTHDRRHFDLPEIHGEIEAVSAMMVFSSSECLRVLRERLP